MNVRKIYLPHSLNLLNAAPDKMSQLISEAQKVLKKLGFYSGIETNKYDDDTREALMNFQTAQELRVTGVLDHPTYCRLFKADIFNIMPKKKEVRAYSGLAKGNILIIKSQRQLTLLDGKTAIRQYPIAIGKPSTPTPEGNYAIATKISNPGGILGTRWMGLNFDAYGIHGTNKPWLIGQMVSNGCIRMHNHHVEELFVLVNIGTPVYIR